jgi:hypothetical protein
MTIYNVHIYREMRLTFKNIEADNRNAAAEIARNKPTGNADDINDCEGVTLAALVDEVGDTEYANSLTIDFDYKQLRNAAPRLLEALKSLIDYAENEAYSLEKLKDSPEAEAEAAKAWNAVETARAIVAKAIAA